ncbi:MAG TPA: hypothetical protein VMY42_20130 [Thermoguttaceae bacterium]|nr:hypothetical protein [Thermoguttaceae bacterium]
MSLVAIERLRITSQKGGLPVRQSSFAPYQRALWVTVLAVTALTFHLSWPSARFLLAAPPPTRPEAPQADSSDEARRSAVQSIPIEKLDSIGRAKVGAVLSKVSIFRRLPPYAVECDPNLYLFMVRHPDVVVNIWEVLKISKLKVQQIGPNTYQVADTVGTSAKIEFLYSSFDTHVLYAEGKYEGALLPVPITGRCLAVLKTGYIRETDGRFYVTSRLDSFLSLEQGGAELLAKTLLPWLGKTADTNFVQSIAFLGSLSKTAEVNGLGVQHLAARLDRVQPELRLKLAELAANIAEKSAVQSSAASSSTPRVAVRDGQ